MNETADCQRISINPREHQRIGKEVKIETKLEKEGQAKWFDIPHRVI